MFVLKCRNPHRGRVGLLSGVLLLAMASMAWAQTPPGLNDNEPGILEPVLSHIEGRDVRIPNTNQTSNDIDQDNVDGPIVRADALTTTSLLGHPITHVASPNDDMFFALSDLADAASNGDNGGMEAAAEELMDILLGTTEGRIYDGFSMLNFNRWKAGLGPEHFGPTAVPNEYKMKEARDTGRTFISPYDGEERRIWEADIAMLYYDGQIDSDTFLVKFPFGHHPDDVLHVNYRIYSLVQEDFSPTLVALDKRKQANTVQFPFKGLDSVWIAFFPGEVLNVTVKYVPLRQLRGVYTWGWRVHPPRIQFMQPVYEIEKVNDGDPNTTTVIWDPQSESFVFRNREDLIIDNISDAAPEKKMYNVAQAVLDGAPAATIDAWLNEPDQGPRGMWFEWANLATEQRQIPPEAQDILLAEDGIGPGEFGDYQMISVIMNNEMYGAGPVFNAVRPWKQHEIFKVKLINLDKHTHYFRNVDFGTRLHDDILRCCGGGETSFEIMNFKPSYGAPKVAEMQWRAGWGFRPHFDVIQQQGVFPRTSDRVGLTPYTGGEGQVHYGFQYSAAHRGGDFPFNPPPFIIGEDAANPSSFTLHDAAGENGLVIGQFTEGYGVGQMCPDDPAPGFCTGDIAAFNPNGALNFPPPPLQGQPVLPPDVGKFPDDIYPDHPVELRFPPFLRNPSQGAAGAGDIIPPTGAWRPFLWLHPENGTIFNDPADPSKGYWADLTFSHGAPVFAGQTLNATIELPRASGQVFYQFDDLFHDNMIFSPHPLAEGTEEPDAFAAVSALRRGQTVRLSGEVEALSSGEQAAWVRLFDGAIGPDGCSGEAVAFTDVSNNGRFTFNLGRNDFPSGTHLCVETVLGALAEIEFP